MDGAGQFSGVLYRTRELYSLIGSNKNKKKSLVSNHTLGWTCIIMCISHHISDGTRRNARLRHTVDS